MNQIMRRIVIAAGITAIGFSVAIESAAADKKPAASPEPTTKTILDNERVKVTQTVFKPGDVSPSRERLPRVSHRIKGGTLERTYPDGKKMKNELKTGETAWLTKDTYSVKNVGKSDVILLTVQPK
jgi:hypothetical protein